MSHYTSNQFENEIPYGYCHCGCGGEPTIAKYDAPERGVYKGKPYLFMRGHKITPSPEERFWSKVDKSGGENTCWIWIGSKLGRGYGMFGISPKKIVRAHRYSYELNTGEIPDNLFVLHHCDNPSCVNPKHLWLGTNDDNMKDMASKHRSSDNKGEKNPNRKLTSENVLWIRERYSQAGITYKKLGDMFGVTKETIHHIIRRIIWKHI